MTRRSLCALRRARRRTSGPQGRPSRKEEHRPHDRSRRSHGRSRRLPPSSCSWGRARARPSAAPSGSAAGKQYVVGVSNTLQGNGWREEMICSIKAQALASGQVSKVVVANRNTDTAGQIEDLRGLISAVSTRSSSTRLGPRRSTTYQGSDRQGHRRGRRRPGRYRPDRLRPVQRPGELRLPGRQVAVRQARRQGQRHLHARHRGRPRGHRPRQGLQAGAHGVPEHQGRQGDVHRLGHHQGAQQIQDIFSAGTQFDGVWTSGIDASVIDAFKTAKQQFKPIVGADNNAFVGYLDSEKANGLVGAAVTNPPPVGGAGVALALKVLNGQAPTDHVAEAHAGGVGQHDGHGAADAEGRLRQDARSVLRGQLHDPGLDHVRQGTARGLQGPGRVTGARDPRGAGPSPAPRSHPSQGP